jgi:hypothetical protein
MWSCVKDSCAYALSQVLAVLSCGHSSASQTSTDSACQTSFRIDLYRLSISLPGDTKRTVPISQLAPPGLTKEPVVRPPALQVRLVADDFELHVFRLAIDLPGDTQAFVSINRLAHHTFNMTKTPIDKIKNGVLSRVRNHLTRRSHHASGPLASALLWHSDR